MTKGFALALVGFLCLAGQTPADELVSSAAAEPVAVSAESISEPAPPMTLVEPNDMAAGDRWWFSTDLLLAWVRGSLLQPLVTTSPPGTPLASAGVLGKQGTSILFGNGRFNDDTR